MLVCAYRVTVLGWSGFRVTGRWGVGGLRDTGALGWGRGLLSCYIAQPLGYSSWPLFYLALSRCSILIWSLFCFRVFVLRRLPGAANERESF
jgi:hypothetical protein